MSIYIVLVVFRDMVYTLYDVYYDISKYITHWLSWHNDKCYLKIVGTLTNLEPLTSLIKTMMMYIVLIVFRYMI